MRNDVAVVDVVAELYVDGDGELGGGARLLADIKAWGDYVRIANIEAQG